jgi:outer membrane protease
MVLGLLAGAGGTSAMHAGDGLPVVSNSFLAVSVQGSLGLLNGKAQENVYTSVGGERFRLSQLDWDIRNVVMLGAEVTVALKNTAWLNFGLWGAANQGNGQMNDWDWLLEEPGSPWTDWSLSSVDLTRAWLLDLNVSVELTRFGALGLRGIAGYKYNTWTWEDHGIRHIYSSDPAVPGGFRNDVRSDPPSTGIIYEQDFHIPYVGAGLTYAAGRWNVDAYALYSPFVVATDYDQHLIRSLDFQEDFTSGQYFGAGVHGTCTFLGQAYATLALDGQIIPETYGDQTVTDTRTGQSESSTGTAGLNNQIWMLSLGVGYKF